MRALITASFTPDHKARLERHMSIVHEDWKETGIIHLDGPSLAERIRAAGADVLIVEADFVFKEVFEGSALRMIGDCRGDPSNVDLRPPPLPASPCSTPRVATPTRSPT
jgi:hypothetical protein